MPLQVNSFERIQAVVLGEVADDRARQQGEVARAGVQLRIGQAGGIGEVGVGHAQALRLAVHQRGEGFLAAGDGLGERHAGVVARLHDHAADELIHTDRLVGLDEHARAFHAPGRGGDRHHLVGLLSEPSLSLEKVM